MLGSKLIPVLGAAFASAGVALAAPGADPALEARLTCETARAPGRVRCTMEVSAPAGRRLDWADALVLETPAFARALRSRVVAREPDLAQGTARLPLALVLEGPGRGVVRVRGRAVLCQADGGRERCLPATRDAQIELVVER
jgi:hypothetical protein